MQLSCRIFGISVERSRRRAENFKDSFFPFFLIPCLPSSSSSPFRLSICRLGSPPAESTVRPQVVNHQPWGIPPSHNREALCSTWSSTNDTRGHRPRDERERQGFRTLAREKEETGRGRLRENPWPFISRLFVRILTACLYSCSSLFIFVPIGLPGVLRVHGNSKQSRDNFYSSSRSLSFVYVGNQ